MNDFRETTPSTAESASALGCSAPPSSPEAPISSDITQDGIPFDRLGVSAEIVRALARAQITLATPVQAATIPAATSGRDLIVQAQTGSGKTLAYVLPLLSRLLEMPGVESTYALIVTPTRELAVQVREVFTILTDSVRPACLIGGASSKDQLEDLGDDRRVIVGTPGRILDMLRRRAILLRTCKYFVLDEADEMLSLGFLEDVRAILSRLPDKRQGLFISATITPRVQMLAQSFLTKPEHLVVKGSNETPQAIEHCYREVGGGITDKVVALCDLIETERPQSVIIFCNTKSDTELVEVYLRRRGFDARRLNSDLSQAQRDTIMTAVRKGDLRILIATDIAARGIDIESIDLVINYSLHDQHEIYVHRTGRTGRAGRSGKAISLIGPQDFTAFINLKRNLPLQLVKLEPPTENDVLLAKLAHFYELVRVSQRTASAKEVDLARGLLKELGDLEHPNEELLQIVAKMYALSMAAINHDITSSRKDEDTHVHSQGERFALRDSRDRNEEVGIRGRSAEKGNRRRDAGGSGPRGGQSRSRRR